MSCGRGTSHVMWSSDGSCHVIVGQATSCDHGMAHVMWSSDGSCHVVVGPATSCDRRANVDQGLYSKGRWRVLGTLQC